jgi:iron-sulfur cluster insertion protein
MHTKYCMNITISDTAINKIADILAEENNPAIHLRMFVQGGGCSGFSYGFTLDEEVNADDWQIPAGLSTILVDSMSAQYLGGAEVDYVEELMGASFKINNPQAQSTCGCGSSFSV